MTEVEAAVERWNNGMHRLLCVVSREKLVSKADDDGDDDVDEEVEENEEEEE